MADSLLGARIRVLLLLCISASSTTHLCLLRSSPSPWKLTHLCCDVARWITVGAPGRTQLTKIHLIILDSSEHVLVSMGNACLLKVECELCLEVQKCSFRISMTWGLFDQDQWILVNLIVMCWCQKTKGPTDKQVRTSLCISVLISHIRIVKSASHLSWTIVKIKLGNVWEDALQVVKHFIVLLCHKKWEASPRGPYSSVQFSCSVVSDSLQLHESQHSRPPCPSPTPGVYLNSCPSSQWCHPAISSSVIPFSSCPQSLPALGSFPVSQLFTSGGQSIEVSASVCLFNEHPGLISFRMDWLISLQSKGLLRVFSNSTVQKHQFFGTQLSSQSNSHIHTWPLEKP